MDIVKTARNALNAIYLDSNVSIPCTRDRLEELKDQIDNLIENLPVRD